MSGKRRVLQAFILAVVLGGCGGGRPPHRPPSVPPEATLIGGPDGGVFLVIEHGSRPGNFKVKVYSDAKGILLYAGPLVLDNPYPPLPSLTDAKIYSGWDGDGMVLVDGRKLHKP